MPLDVALMLAGLAQVVLALASTTFPRILDWNREVARMRPLVQRFFWIYAAYIFVFNLAFGVLSLVGAPWLLDASPLARVVTGFITVYWLARLALQCAVPRSEMPAGAVYRAAETLLVALFVGLAVTYGLAFAANLRG